MKTKENEKLNDPTSLGNMGGLTSLVSKYFDSVLNGLRTYKDELDSSENKGLLYRHAKGVSLGNKVFFEGISDLYGNIHENLKSEKRHQTSGSQEQASIDYEKLAKLVAIEIKKMEAKQ